MSNNVSQFRRDQVGQIEDLLDRLRQNENIQAQNNVAPVTKPVEVKPQDIQEAPAHRHTNVEKQYTDNLANALIKPESFGQSQNGNHRIIIKSSEGGQVQDNPYQANQAQVPQGNNGVSLRQPQHVQNEALPQWMQSEQAYEQAIAYNEEHLRPSFLQPTTKNEGGVSSTTASSSQNEVQSASTYFDASETVTQVAPAQEEAVDAASAEITAADFRFPSDLTKLQEFFAGAEVFTGQGQQYADEDRTQTLIRPAKD